MESYDKMLQTVYEKMPKTEDTGERFEIPTLNSIIEGRTTIISNFKEAADDLRRDPQHLIKFLTKELGTSINLDGKRAIIQGRFKPEQLKTAINNYVDEYVMCKECGKPDTELTTFEGAKYKRCEACGARSPVKPL